MNFETLSLDNQATLATNESDVSSSEQAPEIRQMPMDCFKLVGGGSSIFLFD